MRIVKVINETQGTTIGDQIEVADTSLTRLVGLLGRRSLAPRGGLLLQPSSGVHTIGMFFPIDVIGLDKKMRVVKLWNNFRPYRLTAPSWVLQTVLEVPAGTIQLIGVRLGDTLRISKESPQHLDPPATASHTFGAGPVS